MSTGNSTHEDPSGLRDKGPGTPPPSVVIIGDDTPMSSDDPNCNILQCFICKHPPTEPVFTTCGHVYCWPCMHQWLQNRLQPCLACGYTLRRELDIIPLYGAGESLGATSTDIDIPPRPRNPLLVTVVEPRDYPSVDLLSAGFVLTLTLMLSAYERSIQRLSNTLEAERARVLSLGMERLDLEVMGSDLEERHGELLQSVRERERVLCEEREEMVRSAARMRALKERNGTLVREAQERRQRVRRHLERWGQMGELMARLQRRLEMVQWQLPT